MMDENGLSQFEVSPHMHRENLPQAIQVLKKIQAQLAERFPEDPSKAIFFVTAGEGEHEALLFVAPSQESIPTGDLDGERQHTYYVYVVVTLEGYKLLQLSDENDDIERKRDLQNVIKNAIKNGGKIEGATGFTGNYSDQSFLGIPNLQPLWPPRDISPNDHDWQIVNSVYRRSILSTLGISPDVPSLPLPDSIGVAFSKSSIFRM